MKTMIKIEPCEVQVVVPAGKYYLCDPCYSVPDNYWMTLLQTCEFFDEPIGTITIDEHVYSVLGFRTAYGDGLYSDQYGNSYPVDAGLIGLTPVSLGKYPGDLGQLVEFKKNTICTNNNGDMRFGEYRINTCGEEGDKDETEND
jgi:hypothetical protein